MSAPLYPWTHETLFRYFGRKHGPDVRCRGELRCLGFYLEDVGRKRPRLRRVIVYRCLKCDRFVFATPGVKAESVPPDQCSLVRPRRPRP